MNDTTTLGSNINRIKAHNVRAVLLSILYQEPAYRVQIARDTSLSATTITNIVDELISQGIVTENGIEEVDGRRRVGRPRSALHLVSDARFAIGIQIGVETYRIAIANLKAEVVFNRQHSFSRTTPAAEVVRKISADVEELVKQSQIDRQRIIGVGVGAAGLVNYQTGVNILSSNLGWKDVPLREWISEQLNLPVVVDNNVKAMALGEAYFGSGRNANSLVFVYGRTGVGSGIVVNNRLLRGANLGAGEIGHMIMMAGSGNSCRCGQCGCLETLVAEPALVQAAEQVSQENPGSLLAEYLQQESPARAIERLFNAARDGDPHAKTIVDEAARYLGIALANLVNLLNPQMIVLGGLFSQGQDLFLPTAQETLGSTAFAGLGKEVALQATSFGWQAGVVGAAALALTTFFYLNPEEA